MNTRFRISLSALLIAGLFVPLATAAPAQDADKPEPAAPRIEMAILLDTSGSMEGLINQARTQIWKIVNELATVKQDGRVPELQVALYEYGKSSIPASEGYLRQIVPLSDDLDKISQELFALTTNGGQEYCGHVIDAATKGLQWSDSDDDLKLIFIAGNEPFTQGSVRYQDACSAAIARGITINTIFCGPQQEGVKTGWEDGAKLADGSFLSINQNRQVAAVKTPYDARLSELSSQINKTYVRFGRESDRARSQSLQKTADAAAAGAAPAAAAERAQFKASAQYGNAVLDLSKAIASGKVKLEKLKEDELPKELRGKSLEEKKEYLADKAAEQKKIQKEIVELGDKRKQFIAESRKKDAAKGDNALDDAIIKTIRSQAAKKNFSAKKQEK